jgi:hypothetical protein
MLGYFAYMYLEYAVTWAFGPLFPFFIAIYAASLLGIFWISASLVAEGIGNRFDERFPARPWAVLSVGMSVLLTLLWAGRIATGLAVESPVLHGETTMTVQALDLGLVVPASVLIAMLAWRRHPVGRVAAAAFVVTFIATCAAIAAMLVSAWIVTGVLELPPIVVFGLAAAAAAAIGLRMYRSATPERDARGRGTLRPTVQPVSG